jgi:hypothetical protein
MVRFSSREASPRVAAIGECAVDELATELQLSGGEHTRARVYTPRGVADPPGIVLLHGVHRLGVRAKHRHDLLRKPLAAGARRARCCLCARRC